MARFPAIALVVLLVAALRAQIKTLEREGNIEEAIRLAQELDRRSRRENSKEP
jgi:Flp pilus assembly protein TadD